MKTHDMLSNINSVKQSYRDNIKMNENNTFGIEIEFENILLNKIKYKKGWNVKVDDTVTKYDCGKEMGGEISSPILSNKIECWKEIKDVCNILKNSGAKATMSTGGHIHIGSQVLGNDPDNIRRLFKQW